MSIKRGNERELVANTEHLANKHCKHTFMNILILSVSIQVSLPYIR